MLLLLLLLLISLKRLQRLLILPRLLLSWLPLRPMLV